MTFLEMDTESKFTLLPGCYDNARHLRKCLGIYVIAQGFTKMPSHLRKCPIYDITANRCLIGVSFHSLGLAACVVYHDLVTYSKLKWLLRHIW
jgi:hypothetical protein